MELQMAIYNSYDERLEIRENDIVEYQWYILRGK